MSVEVSDFGRAPEGRTAQLLTLRNRAGAIAKITTFGARLTELHVPDRSGRTESIVLGFDRLEPYIGDRAYLGCTVGRFANRIAGARFTLDGREYRLTTADGRDTLHGGVSGFDQAVWSVRENGPASVVFHHVSPDGDQGFPGTLTVDVTYTLSEENALQIDYAATTDKPTPVNLTNHSYFNLRGAGRGDILEHVLRLAASRYTVPDEALLPTGEIGEVKGTPLDFTTPQAIGSRIDEVPGGYDLNYVLDSGGGRLASIAEVFEPQSGRVMEVLTTEPGVQLYTANFLDGSLHGIGGAYVKHGGLCLETQHFPDSVNHPSFPSTILRSGETYRQTTVYRFSVR